MDLVDRVKYDAGSDDIFVWKFPHEALRIGSQVIVNQSQDAVFVKGGDAQDLLGPGTHTLNTGNIPLLDKLINLPFDGKTPFTAEIWYVNKTAKRDLKWGTPSPIQVMDPNVGYPISVRAFGRWGVRIDDSRSFVSQLVGSQIGADAQKIHNYFIGEINQKLSAVLASAISVNQISLFNINASLNQLSEILSKELEAEFVRFGVELVNINIENVNIPEEEMAKIQEVFAKKMEVEQLSKTEVGQGYATVKTFETLNSAAENSSEAGSLLGGALGAGVGIGAGIPLGQQLGRELNIDTNKEPVQEQKAAQNVDDDDAAARLNKLKALLDQGLITQEQYDVKQQEILKDL